MTPLMLPAMEYRDATRKYDLGRTYVAVRRLLARNRLYLRVLIGEFNA